jgi:hypothetical protein
MQPYDYVNKEWIVSSRARRVYRLAAILSLTLYPILTAQIVGEVPKNLGPVMEPLLFASIVGAAITAVGMEFFLFRFDDSHPLKQVFWFCAMLFVPLGPALYCFLVYSTAINNRLAPQQEVHHGP